MDKLEQMRRKSERIKKMFPPGTRGTVDDVDDIGTIFPKWDNGSGLGLVYGEDRFRRLTPEELEEERLAAEQEARNDVGMQM